MKLKYHKKFKKDLKKLQKRCEDLSLLKEVIMLLCKGKELPKKYRDHSLTGEYAGYRDCHIQNDWVLIYKIEEELSLLSLHRTGTHSDLFKK